MMRTAYGALCRQHVACSGALSVGNPLVCREAVSVGNMVACSLDRASVSEHVAVNDNRKQQADHNAGRDKRNRNASRTELRIDERAGGRAVPSSAPGLHRAATAPGGCGVSAATDDDQVGALRALAGAVGSRGPPCWDYDADLWFDSDTSGDAGQLDLFRGMGDLIDAAPDDLSGLDG